MTYIVQKKKIKKEKTRKRKLKKCMINRFFGIMDEKIENKKKKKKIEKIFCIPLCVE